MSLKSDFVDYIIDNLSDLDGHIYSKRMFGGFGIYHNDVMFGLISNDEFFLKVNDKSVSKFTALDLKPFTYERQGKDVALSYYQAPATAIEDPEILVEWAKLSISTANRST